MRLWTDLPGHQRAYVIQDVTTQLQGLIRLSYGCRHALVKQRLVCQFTVNSSGVRSLGVRSRRSDISWGGWRVRGNRLHAVLLQERIDKWEALPMRTGNWSRSWYPWGRESRSWSSRVVREQNAWLRRRGFCKRKYWLAGFIADTGRWLDPIGVSMKVICVHLSGFHLVSLLHSRQKCWKGWWRYFLV